MSVPYETSQGGLHVTGGDVGCFEIPFPSRVYLTKIVVVQTAGVPVNFDVDIFNRGDVCMGSSLSEEGEPLPESLFKVTPTLNGVAGILEEFNGNGYSFHNQDTVVNGKTKGALYLRISPSGGGVKEFAVSLAAKSDLV